MKCTRRFFVSVASAATALGLLPKEGKAEKRKLSTLKRVGAQTELEPEKPKMPSLKLGCARVYEVGITMTSHAVKNGDAVWHNCKGKPEVVGMALTEAPANSPVMIMVGFVPSGAVLPGG